MSLTKKYLSSSIVGLIGKGFNMISMLGILWLLNAILDKEGFGLFMVSFSMMFIVAMILASGFQALLIYHVSRLHEKGAEARIKAITSQIFWMTAGLSCIAAGGVYLLARPIENIMNLEGLSRWISLMAPFIPAHASAIVLPTLPRARQKAEQTILYQEILLNGLRVLFLACIWLASMPASWTASAYIFSAMIPVILIFAKYPLWPTFKNTPLSLWDFKYVSKIAMFQVLNQPFRGLDVLLVGAFASAGAAADYTMATRLTQLLWIPKHAASQLQVPRMGALLDSKNYSQLMLEYNAMRSMTLFMVLGGCAFLLFFGLEALTLFGDYAGAFPVLLLLAAAAVMRTGVGTSGDLMSQSGHAGWSAFIAGLSMLVTIGGCVLLVPLWNANGAGLAVLLGTIVLFTGFAIVLKTKENLNTMPKPALLVTLSGMMVLAFAVSPEFPVILAGFSCIILAIILITLDRSWLRFLKDKTLV